MAYEIRIDVNAAEFLNSQDEKTHYHRSLTKLKDEHILHLKLSPMTGRK